MSIRDKIAQQYINSCLIIDVAECVKADMAQAPKVCWQCGLSFADTILAIEVNNGRCNHPLDGAINTCIVKERKCNGCKFHVILPATIADLMEVE